MNSKEFATDYMNFNEIKERLEQNLDPNRYEHTIAVMYTAANLAMLYDYSLEKAMLAGLLHDCAKCISNIDKIKICAEHNISISEVEQQNPSLLHAKAGAIIAKEEYHIIDSEILHAISIHTTGEPNMNILDKIIFIADYIEPNRSMAPNLAYIRKLAYQDINACLKKILEDTLAYLKQKNGIIDSKTELTYQYYCNK